MKRPLTRLILPLLVSAMLSGCGMFGGSESAEVVEDSPHSAPATKDLLKSLPHDLRGDRKNARYTNQPLRGEEDEGG